MAISLSQNDTSTVTPDNASDYGSDIDDETAFSLLSQAELQAPVEPSFLASIEDIPIPVEHESLEQRIHLRLSRLQQSLDSVRESSARIEAIVGARRAQEASVEIEYDEINRGQFSPVRQDESQATQTQQEEVDLKTDTRSPIERWRTKPKKPLSVTDLVSPAWCEQQYEYNLSKYGRIRATKAMKEGSKVHKVLEEQVHTAVPVETVSKEDAFGLRIWNTIEGLRTLREDGLTRELEVWGVLQGEVVIGIIDEISTTCPDEQMEADMLDGGASKGGKKGKKVEQLAPGQQTLTDFLTSSQTNGLLQNDSAFLGTLHPEKPRTYYLKDIKTRQSRTLPGPGAASRPTHMQLMLYHRLLTSLAANEVPADTVFTRYGLDPHTTFSDKFIAEIANLNVPPPTSQNDSEALEPGREDPLTVLLAHNTLTALWTLMISEFQLTFPPTTSPSISPLLTASFRTASAHSATEPAGSIIGTRVFFFDPPIINAYLRSEMAWWKGERATVGVEVEEAYKCARCDFAEGCTWRRGRVEEGLRKARLRREGRGRSEV
ncbi:uncharacterized protein LTR77_006030 [Saxophila tyrrhenica]|uniref:Exonuclease V n=1 Tax=Saxophila tyrrhenica TaxID=1690608 RepID=A0AAV9P6Q7_9PEZI|nr:hypothetical protein LTR77_006030 [Saxophila tyrrhenica]